MKTLDLPISYYSSLSRRVGACVLDWMILFIPTLVFHGFIPVLGGVIAAFLYYPVFESSALQATPGKKLMGIQVGDSRGARISFRMATVRWIVACASATLMFFGHLLAVFTRRKQALHDLVAETVVVYGRRGIPVPRAWLDSVSTLVGRVGAEPATGSMASEVEALERLRSRGVLTDEEFQSAKARLFT
jgi:uncharacterized RDD family membrane protein YckC